jgi:hypothetical protein
VHFFADIFHAKSVDHEREADVTGSVLPESGALGVGK